jgi:hypothetical protein
MEYLRLDNSFVGGINANQALMLVIALAAAAVIVWRHRAELFHQDSQQAGEKDLPEGSDDPQN